MKRRLLEIPFPQVKISLLYDRCPVQGRLIELEALVFFLTAFVLGHGLKITYLVKILTITMRCRFSLLVQGTGPQWSIAIISKGLLAILIIPNGTFVKGVLALAPLQVSHALSSDSSVLRSLRQKGCQF